MHMNPAIRWLYPLRLQSWTSIMNVVPFGDTESIILRSVWSVRWGQPAHFGSMKGCHLILKHGNDMVLYKCKNLDVLQISLARSPPVWAGGGGGVWMPKITVVRVSSSLCSPLISCCNWDIVSYGSLLSSKFSHTIFLFGSFNINSVKCDR